MYKKTYDVGKPRHFFDLAINISDEFYKSKVLGSGTQNRSRNQTRANPKTKYLHIL